MAPLLEKPKTRTLRAEVVDILRDAIVTGKLKPGEHLAEPALARELSVSRSPVREALRQLEQEGLVVAIPNQGSFVKTFDEQDVTEIFTLRATLENLAFEIVLKEDKLDADDFDVLESTIEQQRAAIKAQNFDQLTKLDVAFHEFICRKSGFERLVKMWKSLRAQLQVLFYQRFEAYDWVPETVDTDHSAILDALRQGDLERVRAINKRVNQRTARECIEVLESIQEPPEGE